MTKIIILFSLFFSQVSLADQTYGELTMYSIPSASEIAWSSPGKLGRSSLVSTVVRNFKKGSKGIGHIMVGVRCYKNGELIEDSYSGMNSFDGKESNNLLLKKQSGMGVILHNFKGYQEDKEQVLSQIDETLKHYKMAVVTYKVNYATCERLVDFAKEYGEMGYGFNYGSYLHKPRYRQGAGCIAYAQTFLELAGIYNESFMLKTWGGEIYIPNKIIGPYNRTLYTSSKYSEGKLEGSRKVNVLGIMLGFYRWGKPGDANTTYVKWYDPSVLYRWAYGNYQKSFTGSVDKDLYKVEKKNKSYYLYYDKSYLETPTSNLFLN